MRKIFIVILLLLISSNVFPQSQKELLYKAYQDSSYKLLEQFFENWRLKKTPITDEEYENLSDVQKDVYDLFYEFYNPLNLSNLKLEEFEYDFYKNVKYAIINPYIRYSFTETLNADSIKMKLNEDLMKLYYDSADRSIFNDNDKDTICSSEDSIIDFRPRVKFKDANVLYYNLYYDSLLSEFIGSDIVPLGNYDIMQPAYADSTSEKKIEFLSSYIFIMASHWGTYWEIQTSPKVQEITFDKNRTTAKIVYEFPYHGNYSIFERKNDKWIFIKDVFESIW
ncbi:MAG: hypothetical protein H8D45_31110 [Bacteroidetes bacterium]|nr:hypothetical protein [Bacteroidota bacterium]